MRLGDFDRNGMDVIGAVYACLYCDCEVNSYDGGFSDVRSLGFLKFGYLT